MVESIFIYLNNRGLSRNKVASVGCDETIVNTEHKEGVIRILNVTLIAIVFMSS